MIFNLNAILDHSQQWNLWNKPKNHWLLKWNRFSHLSSHFRSWRAHFGTNRPEVPWLWQALGRAEAGVAHLCSSCSCVGLRRLQVTAGGTLQAPHGVCQVSPRWHSAWENWFLRGMVWRRREPWWGSLFYPFCKGHRSLCTNRLLKWSCLSITWNPLYTHAENDPGGVKK